MKPFHLVAQIESKTEVVSRFSVAREKELLGLGPSRVAALGGQASLLCFVLDLLGRLPLGKRRVIFLSQRRWLAYHRSEKQGGKLYLADVRLLSQPLCVNFEVCFHVIHELIRGAQPIAQEGRVSFDGHCT